MFFHQLRVVLAQLVLHFGLSEGVVFVDGLVHVLAVELVVLDEAGLVFVFELVVELAEFALELGDEGFVVVVDGAV